tara:strand:- start:281 stop:619 length:339 start_codon:yes stop_codon:yes gene_type:complete
MVDYTNLLTPMILIMWISLSILLISKINSLIDHKPARKNKNKQVTTHFAILAIVFFAGFLVLQNLELTGMAARNLITGLTPTAETPDDFSLGITGIFIALLGVVLFFISKKR